MPPSLQAGRLPVPAAARVREAAGMVRDLFAGDYVRPGADDRLRLAQKLLERAREMEGDPSTRFALLSESARIAADASFIDQAMQAVHEATRWFAIDGPEFKLQVLDSALRWARSDDSIQAVGLSYVELAGEARALGRHELAGRAARAGQRVAIKTRNLSLASRSRLEAEQADEAARLAPAESGPLTGELTVLEAPPTPDPDTQPEGDADDSRPAAPLPVQHPQGRYAGMRLGGFILDERLGQGAMAEVYRGRQRSLGRPVAIKVLDPALAAQGDVGRRFAQEAQAAARLDHPHIVQVIDYGVDSGFSYIALELIEGSSLESLLQERGRLPEREALELTIAIASALEYAHGHDVLHRDVKPENVMLTAEGSAKLADFGLARVLSDQSRLTQAGTVMGTPNYMAPEQALASSSLDGRCDLYALGLVLYRCLTGELPWSGSEGPLSVLTAHINDDVPDPRRANPEVSAAAARVVARLTQRELDQRCPSATEALVELRRALRGEHPSLDPAAATAGARGWGRPLWALAATALLAAGAALWATQTPATPQSQPAVADAAVEAGAYGQVELARACGELTEPDARERLLAALADATPSCERGFRWLVTGQQAVLRGLEAARGADRAGVAGAVEALDELASRPPAGAGEERVQATLREWLGALRQVHGALGAIEGAGDVPAAPTPRQQAVAQAAFGPDWVAALRAVGQAARAFDAGDYAQAQLEPPGAAREGLPWVSSTAVAVTRASGRLLAGVSVLESLETVAADPSLERCPFVRARLLRVDLGRRRGWSHAPGGLLADDGPLAGQGPLLLGEAARTAELRLEVSCRGGHGALLLTLDTGAPLGEEQHVQVPLHGPAEVVTGSPSLTVTPADAPCEALHQVRLDAAGATFGTDGARLPADGPGVFALRGRGVLVRSATAYASPAEAP